MRKKPEKLKPKLKDSEEELKILKDFLSAFHQSDLTKQNQIIKELFNGLREKSELVKSLRGLLKILERENQELLDRDLEKRLENFQNYFLSDREIAFSFWRELKSLDKLEAAQAAVWADRGPILVWNIAIGYAALDSRWVFSGEKLMDVVDLAENSLIEYFEDNFPKKGRKKAPGELKFIMGY